MPELRDQLKRRKRGILDTLSAPAAELEEEKLGKDIPTEEEPKKQPSLIETVRKEREPLKKTEPEDERPAPGTKEHKSAVADRSKFKDIFAPEGQQLNLRTPDDVKSLSKKLGEMQTMIDAARLPEIETRRSVLAHELKEAEKDFKATRDQAQWLEIAQEIGQALFQLAAGAYGLRHNVNLAGLRFNKKDWSKSIDRSLRELQDKRQETRLERRELAAEERDIVSRLERRREEKPELERLKEEKTRAEIEQIRRKTAEVGKKAEEARKELDLTPGEKKVDEVFSKDYNQYIAQGGQADAKKNIRQLERVVGKLGEIDTATGRIVGLAPKFLRDVVTPEGAALQDSAEEVIQRNLRIILGAQFTEREGERLISRAYNPRLDEKENARRLANLVHQMKEAHQNKVDAARYYEENGTLKGFKGKLYRSVNDFDVTGKEAPAKGKMTRDQKLKRLEELRKKARGE